MTTRLLRFLTLLICLLALLALAPAAVAAEAPGSSLQDEDENEGDEPDDSVDDEDSEDDLDLDRDGRSRRVRPSDRKGAKKKRDRPVREVVKGAYAKINMGPLFWLGGIKGDNVTSTGTDSTGTEIDFSFGYDIVDTLGFTLAVEGSFFQTITNGTGVSERLFERFGLQSAIQGDFRVFGAIASVRAGPNVGGKRVKRLNISGHAGGGIGYSPVLIDLTNQEVSDDILREYGDILQGHPLGLIQAGASIEYYTKLSHFSLGLDIDFNVMIGPVAPTTGAPIVAMGLATNIFVKYTF